MNLIKKFINYRKQIIIMYITNNLFTAFFDDSHRVKLFTLWRSH